jgi:LPS export ABC transporter protein LptC
MKYGIFLAVLALLVTACADRKQATIEEAPPFPEQALEKFTITETESGQPHWVLEAASAQIMEQEKRALLQLPRVKFYENGVYTSTLVAARGRINTETYDIWADSGCVITTAKGEVLETSNLEYRAATKKVYTNEAVKITRPNEIVYGHGMEATPDLESIIIRKQRTEVRQ